MRHFAVSLVHEMIYWDSSVVGCSTGAISNYYSNINKALSIECKLRCCFFSIVFLYGKAYINMYLRKVASYVMHNRDVYFTRDMGHNQFPNWVREKKLHYKLKNVQMEMQIQMQMTQKYKCWVSGANKPHISYICIYEPQFLFCTMFSISITLIWDATHSGSWRAILFLYFIVIHYIQYDKRTDVKIHEILKYCRNFNQQNSETVFQWFCFC